MIRTEARNEDDLQLNMTPMIDMVFLLIIFFLTATTFTQKEREQDVLLPATRGAGSLSKALEESVIVNIKKDGGIFVSGRKYGHDDLRGLIASQKERARGALKVKVRADARALHGAVAQVLAAIEKAGVTRPYIDTRQELLEP